MKYEIKGELYNPVKVGDEGDFYNGADKHEICGDCGAAIGEYHVAGCDCERCPACGLQLITCDCGVVNEVYEQDDSGMEA